MYWKIEMKNKSGIIDYQRHIFLENGIKKIKNLEFRTCFEQGVRIAPIKPKKMLIVSCGSIQIQSYKSILQIYINVFINTFNF